MRKFFLLFLYIYTVLSSMAQNISVKSFSLDETDVTANLQGTTVLDQNGEKCALIKIFTTATGFTFDVGSLGVQKVEQKTGEIWLYVPQGVRRLTMNHAQLGKCEYTFTIPVEKAYTYNMELVAGEVQTIIKNAVTSQYVLFRVTPSNASVEIDGQMLEVRDGGASKRMPFGTYDYKVQAPRYYAKSGQVTVNDPQNKHIVNVSLEPAFSTVTMQVDADAEIWIDDTKCGTRTFTGELAYGTYLVECRQQGHRTSQKEVTITKENASQKITLPKPTPIYGSIDVNSSPLEANIYIDDKHVGTTPMLLPNYLVGTHRVRLSKAGHSDFSQLITVEEGQTFEVNAKLDSGREVAISTAPGAEIFVDGKSVGNTQYTGNLTFGSHTIYAMLNGKRSGKKKIDIAVGNDKINIQLTFGNKFTYTVGGVSFTMIFVEGGTFTMGATSEQSIYAYDWEKPAHSVTLSDYYIGQTEVTQSLWQKVMGSNPSYYKGGNRPVENVSWNDCQTFISKLNSMTGRNFRLPTEAEWEYAARGGSKSMGYKYSGSNDINAVAVYERNSYYKDSSSPYNGTQPIKKSKTPNELGIYDMSGNVYEWCNDWYGLYNSGSQTNPKGALSGWSRVIRGGSWFNASKDCRVSFRSYCSPNRGYNYTGLRLAMSK
jgi:formylglycine-generating enzyme required for sulfatase activity